MRGGVVRIEGGDSLVLGFGTGPVPIVQELDVRERCVDFCERRIKSQGFARSFPSFEIGFFQWESAASAQLQEGVREAGIGERVAGISGDGFLEVVERSE